VRKESVRELFEYKCGYEYKYDMNMNIYMSMDLHRKQQCEEGVGERCVRKE